MKETTRFKISLADLVFDVSSSLSAANWFCRDYLVPADTEASYRIRIGDAEIRAEREYLEKTGEDCEDLRAEKLELMVLFRNVAERLPENDRLLFHGSSLAFDGSGVLFTARSGTGKSTHTRLWRKVFGDRVKMINDDKPFLHFTEDGVRIYGTPWRGKHLLGCNMSAPLKALCVVYRGSENRIEAMDPKEALPLLLQQTYRPAKPEDVVKTLALVDRLAKQVPVYRLSCTMDEEAAEVACAGINFN